jgi:coenzyme F420 hydrogenase subunit beta
MSYNKLNNEVIQPGICCGCGACVGVCPGHALHIDIHSGHEPVMDASKCTNCGLCLEVCPGQGYPAVQWSRRLCDEITTMMPERGPVRHHWLGKATDPEICSGGASGGVATALLLHLLASNQVDDVAVIGMENERPVARLTHDPDVIRSAQMSKYGPVPMLSTIIPELMMKPRRIAMTCTPCQLGGWLRAQERLPRLRENDVLSIGLFCGQIQSYDVLHTIAETMKIRYPGGAEFLAWRAGDYPGNARFRLPDGVIVDKPLYPWLDVAVPHFSLKRCFLCPDASNWMADMTLGDNHKGLVDGTVIVCRSKRGEAALQSAKAAGTIEYESLSADRIASDPVLKGITGMKLFPAIARNAWLKNKGLPSPKFDYTENAAVVGYSNKRALMKRLWVFKYRMTFWFRSGWRRRFLLRYPYLMEKTGHFLYYFPVTLPGWRWLAAMKGKLR